MPIWKEIGPVQIMTWLIWLNPIQSRWFYMYDNLLMDKAQKQGLLYPAWIYYTTLSCSRC